MGRPKGSLNKKPPKYCIHKRAGRAFINLPNRPPLYLDGPANSPQSKEHYYRVLAEMAANGGLLPAQPPRTVEDPGPTVSELIAAYWSKQVMMQWCGESEEMRGKRSSIRHTLSLLNELYGNTPAAEFSTDRFLTVRDTLVARGRRDGKPYMRTTINVKTFHIILAFKWAAPRKLVPSTIYHDLMAIGKVLRKEMGDRVREPVPVKAVDDAVVEATLPFCPPIVAAAVKLQRRTGMRSGEMLIMRGVDIDMTPTSEAVRSRCIACRDQGRPCKDHTCWIYRPTKFKGQYRDPEYVKEIYFGERCQEILRPLLTTDLTAYIFRPAATAVACQRHHPSYRAPVLRRRRRMETRCRPYYSVRNYWGAIDRAIDNADAHAHTLRPDVPADVRLVPKWKPHQLRHARATEIEQMENLAAAQAALDHRSSATTKRYAHERQKRAKEIAAAVG